MTTITHEKIEFGSIIAISNNGLTGTICVTKENSPVSETLQFSFAKRRQVSRTGTAESSLEWVDSDPILDTLLPVRIDSRLAFERQLVRGVGVVGFWAPAIEYVYAIAIASANRYVITSNKDGAVVWEGMYSSVLDRRINVRGVFPECVFGHTITCFGYGQTNVPKQQPRKFKTLQEARVLDHPNRRKATTTGRHAI
jgi:hypothetical protein